MPEGKTSLPQRSGGPLQGFLHLPQFRRAAHHFKEAKAAAPLHHPRSAPPDPVLGHPDAAAGVAIASVE